MYIYNSENNELVEIEMTNFTQNGIKERDHIEEWIRKKPDVLGDDLLIIAHEYDKFEVNERIDLLALDKDGALVIIELKRDSTGANVDFQSLKYCSYCSQLTPPEIIEIYTEYLQKNHINENPIDNIALHLGLDSESEDKINELLNNTQKFIIVGRDIDKRILSVCAWLTDNGINCKCLTIKPHKNDSDSTIFIDIDQIIPPYTISDYYLGAKEKKNDSATIYQSDDIIQFFEAIATIVTDKTSFKVTYNRRKTYCTITSGKGIQYGLVYQKRSQQFIIEALARDVKLKIKMESFFEANKNLIEKDIHASIIFRPEGERNLNWCRITTSVKKDTDTKLDAYINEVSSLYILFCQSIHDNWK